MIQFNEATQSPAVQLIQNVDFRIESLQQMISGRLLPGQRRMKIVRKRRRTLNEELFNGDISTGSSDGSDFRERVREENPNTSERASATGTASKSDIEGAPPKAGANRPDNEEPVRLTDPPEREAANVPSMSEAGIQR